MKPQVRGIEQLQPVPSVLLADGAEWLGVTLGLLHELLDLLDGVWDGGEQLDPICGHRNVFLNPGKGEGGYSTQMQSNKRIYNLLRQERRCQKSALLCNCVAQCGESVWETKSQKLTRDHWHENSRKRLYTITRRTGFCEQCSHKACRP